MAADLNRLLMLIVSHVCMGSGQYICVLPVSLYILAYSLKARLRTSVQKQGTSSGFSFEGYAMQKESLQGGVRSTMCFAV